MTNALDDLKAAYNAPTPDPAKRAADLALAQRNFDAHQGSPHEARHKPVTGHDGLWTGIKHMLSHLTSKGGLTATTALAACGLLFLTPTSDLIWPKKVATQQVATPSLEAALAAAPGNFITPQPIEDEGFVGTMPAPDPRGIVIDPSELMIATDEAPFAAMTARVATQSVLRHAPDIVRPASNETFANADPNPLKIVSENPVSTFSIDVDTASYAIVRNTILRGQLPSAEAVRIEEMINYFPYDYPAPDAHSAPFQPTISVMPTPWNTDTQLVHIAIQGALPAITDRPALNLVFLIDTSGSMDDAAKLPLLKQSFMLMLDQLRPDDEVAIVTYAGSAGQILPPTPARDRDAIRAALNNLSAGGGTNGQGGLDQAYALARDMTQDGEVSRILLATDGDFNVGISDPSGLESFIAKQRDSGVFLSVLGFGRGNLNDQTMQTLAQNGNGTAAYIDTLAEAQKVLVDQLTGALFPIASDVKVQVEFDPGQIAEYRLIGYETRTLNREDFNNDKVDAGDLGAGHRVTALYEITPVGSPARLTDPLRYDTGPITDQRSEIGFVKLRYKTPGAQDSQLLETPILRDSIPAADAGFAAAIAGFGQILRESRYLGDWTLEDAIALANQHKGADPFGYRAEAIQLMRLANSLSRH